jgi:hypothetical protein
MNSLRAILIASLSFVLLFFGQTYAADKTFTPGNPDYVKKAGYPKGEIGNVSYNAMGERVAGSCPRAGSISGKVTNSGGTGIGNVYVDVYDSDGNRVKDYYGYNYYGCTSDDGTYTVADLAPGSYYVRFRTYEPDISVDSIYGSQWYNSKATFSVADTVTVTSSNDTSGINAKFTAGGGISGKVTRADGGAMAYVGVEVYDTDGLLIKNATTGEDGTYAVTGLATGGYKVRLTGYDRFCSSSKYASQWYNKKGDFDAADTVAVTAPNVTSGINAKLAVGGRISGKVTNSDGTGIWGIYVYVYDTDGYLASCDNTGDDGTYTVKGLATGNYKIQFMPSDNSGYAGEWYNDKTYFDTADTVAVTAPNVKSGINAKLAKKGGISGKVTDSDGTGIYGVYVYAYDSEGNIASYYNFTDSDGTYTQSGLAPGIYKLKFDADVNQYSCHVTEWYTNKTDFNTANSVVVTDGNITPGINATLVGRGSITGTITDLFGVVINNVGVSVYDTCGNAVGGGWTGDDGTYTAQCLSSGNYKVWFNPADAGIDGALYAAEWYNKKADFQTADMVAIAAPGATSGINAQIVGGGAISGKVTDSHGVGIAKVHVVAFVADGNWYGYDDTEENGEYIVSGLAPGSYKLQFYSTGGLREKQWYNNKLNSETADAVTVTVKNVTSGIDVIFAGSVRIYHGGDFFTLYSSIQNAYDAESIYAHIQARELVMTESLVFGSDTITWLAGGYDDDFSTNSGTFTTLRGSLLIKGGTVTIENFIIK